MSRLFYELTASIYGAYVGRATCLPREVAAKLPTELNIQCVQIIPTLIPQKFKINLFAH